MMMIMVAINKLCVAVKRRRTSAAGSSPINPNAMSTANASSHLRAEDPYFMQPSSNVENVGGTSVAPKYVSCLLCSCLLDHISSALDTFLRVVVVPALRIS